MRRLFSKVFSLFYSRNFNPKQRFTWFLVLLTLMVLGIGCRPKTEAVTGKLKHLYAFDSQYIGQRQVDIWLPENYPEDAPYAVIYMHDGENLFDATKTWNGQEWGVDQVLTRLMQEQKIRPVIVASVWNAGRYRRAEYLPQKPFEMLPEAIQDSLYQAYQKPDWPLFPKKVYSDLYLKFITRELKPYVDENFQVNPSQENTFIIGSSMGGLISMYAMLEYPEVFGGAGCLSTHWYGIHQDNAFMGEVFLEFLQKNLMPPGKHRWYFDYGTLGIDSLYEPYQMRADSIFTAAGYSTENWVTKKYEGHKHEENSWRSRLHVPMEFLLR